MFKRNRSIFLKFISLFMLMIFFVSCNNDNSNVIGVDNSVPKAPLSKSASQAISLEMYKGPIKIATDGHAEWYTQFEVKVILPSGENIANQCNITFYNKKGHKSAPPVGTWKEIGYDPSCADPDDYEELCSFDGEFIDGAHFDDRYLWLKAVVKNSVKQNLFCKMVNQRPLIHQEY
jgi:hypothetical protein